MPQPWPQVSADHANVTSRGPARRRDEAAGRRLAPGAEIGQVLERARDRRCAARRQADEIDARGEVGVLERRGPDDAATVGEKRRWSRTRPPSAPTDRLGSTRSRDRARRRRARPDTGVGRGRPCRADDGRRAPKARAWRAAPAPTRSGLLEKLVACDSQGQRYRAGEERRLAARAGPPAAEALAIRTRTSRPTGSMRPSSALVTGRSSPPRWLPPAGRNAPG